MPDIGFPLTYQQNSSSNQILHGRNPSSKRPKIPTRMLVKETLTLDIFTVRHSSSEFKIYAMDTNGSIYDDFSHMSPS